MKDRTRKCLRLVLFVQIIILAWLPASAGAAEMRAGVAKAVITNDKPLVMVNGRVYAAGGVPDTKLMDEFGIK